MLEYRKVTISSRYGQPAGKTGDQKMKKSRGQKSPVILAGTVITGRDLWTGKEGVFFHGITESGREVTRESLFKLLSKYPEFAVGGFQITIRRRGR